MIKKTVTIIIMILIAQMTVYVNAVIDVKPLPFGKDSWKNYELGSGEFANGGLRLKGRSGLFVLKEKADADVSYEFNCKKNIEKESSAGIIIGMQIGKGMPWDNYNSSYIFEFADNRVSLIRFIGAVKTILQTKDLDDRQWLAESRIVVGSEKNGENVGVFIKINGVEMINYKDNEGFAGNGGYFGFYSLNGGQIAAIPFNGEIKDSNDIDKQGFDWILFIAIIAAVISLVIIGVFEIRKRKQGLKQ